MKGIKTILAAGAMLAVLCAGAPAFGQSQPLAQKVDLDLKDADLMHALQALTVQTGVEFIIQGASKDYPGVTLNLRNVSGEEALRYICEAAGVFAIKDENGVFKISAEKPADTSTGPVITEPKAPVVTKKPTVLRKIVLMKGDGQAIYDTLVYGVNINDQHMAEIMERDRSAAKNLGAGNMAFRSPIKTTVPVAEPVGINSPVPPTTGAGDITIPGVAANQGLLGGGGQPGGGGGQLGGGGGQLGGGGQGQGGGTGLQGGQGLVPDGIQDIIYDPTTNSFIVRGDEEAIRELERLIEQFDVAPTKVYVDVKYVTTSNSVDKSLGIDWLYQRGPVSAGAVPGSLARAGDPVFINYATGNISTRLRTLLSEGWGRVVTNPSVITLNNQTATFLSNIQTYIFVPVINQGNGNIVTVFQPIPITSSTVLAVRPRVNNDGTITMGLTPQISEFGQIRSSPDGSTQVPDVLTQAFQVVVRLRSGETVALGGLVRKQDTNSRNKIPVLADLPIIGQLFQSRITNKNNQDLTVFVTATILEDDEFGYDGP